MFAERRNSGVLDLEAVEQATRDALHQAGARLLETLLNEEQTAEPRQSCACGEQARYAGKRAKKLVTMLGTIVVERAYYSLPPLRQRLRATRPRAGCRSDAVLAGRAPHDSAGRQRNFV